MGSSQIFTKPSAIVSQFHYEQKCYMQSSADILYCGSKYDGVGPRAQYNIITKISRTPLLLSKDGRHYASNPCSEPSK